MKKQLLSLALIAATFTPMAHAWLREGHRLTALVAQDHLTPVAADNIKFYLGKDTMADISDWGDKYRTDHPETAPWHYTDIPGAEDFYVRERDCPLPPKDAKGTWRDCSVDRIPYLVGLLKDPTTPKDQKILCLKLLIHFIGDLHQPLHNINDARGGNQIKVTAFGATTCGGFPCNLHGVWDGELIEHRNLSEKKYVALLEEEITTNNWQQKASKGTVVDWSNAAHVYAQNAWVANGAFLNKDYYEKQIKVVDQQLALAGLRMANILNDIFSTPPPAAK